MANRPSEPDLDVVDSGWEEPEPPAKPLSVRPVAADGLDAGWDDDGEVAVATPTKGKESLVREQKTAHSKREERPKPVKSKRSADERAARAARKAERRAKKSKARRDQARATNAQANPKAKRVRTQRPAKAPKTARASAGLVGASPMPDAEPASSLPQAAPSRAPAKASRSPSPGVETANVRRVAFGVLMALAFLTVAWLAFRRG